MSSSHSLWLELDKNPNNFKGLDYFCKSLVFDFMLAYNAKSVGLLIISSNVSATF